MSEQHDRCHGLQGSQINMYTQCQLLVHQYYPHSHSTASMTCRTMVRPFDRSIRYIQRQRLNTDSARYGALVYQYRLTGTPLGNWLLDNTFYTSFICRLSPDIHDHTTGHRYHMLLFYTTKMTEGPCLKRDRRGIRWSRRRDSRDRPRRLIVMIWQSRQKDRNHQKRQQNQLTPKADNHRIGY